MKTYIILLRGIMPTGKNKVPMAQLREELAAAGLKDARTYIQTGNVIVHTDLKPQDIETLVHKTIKAKFSGDIVVVVRTPKQIENVLKNNPFPKKNLSRTYFTLFALKPSTALLKEFLATDFSPDKINIVEDVLYTQYATKHSDSKFNNNVFERKLKVSATTRNFNTMSKILELSSQ